MIICHCQGISDHQIRAAVDWMRAADPETIITPGKIYRALGKRADCGGCMPLFLDTLRQSASFGIATTAQPSSHPIPVLAKGKDNEGRSQGHRLSQRGAAL